MDGYQVIERTVGDWHCVARYRVTGDGAYDIRWWVVENQKDGKVFSWMCANLDGHPEGDYPIMAVYDGPEIKFAFPRDALHPSDLEPYFERVRGKPAGKQLEAIEGNQGMMAGLNSKVT